MSEIGNARSRLAARMRGKEVRIDNMELNRIAAAVVKETPGIRCPNTDCPIFTFSYGNEYAIQVSLEEYVVKDRALGHNGIELRYELEYVRIPKTGNSDADKRAIKDALLKAIAEKRARNTKAIKKWLSKQA